MKDQLWPVGVFLVVGAIGFGARQLIGSVYGEAEATNLIDALSRAGLYLGSAVVTASATTLALMLTLIGMLRRLDQEFDNQAYRNVNLIAKLATASLMMGLLNLLAFVLPVGEFDNLPARWYATVYDVLFAGTVTMVGLIAATVAVIYRTLRRIVGAVTPGEAV